MSKYIIRRILASVPVILGVTVLVFLTLHLTPGDPARLLAGPEAYEEDIELLREKLGLNDPLLVQYGRFLVNAVTFDFGTSFRTGRLVRRDIVDRLPHTAELALASLIWAVPVGVVVGIYAGVRPNSLGDGASMAGALLGVSTPTFWLGLLLMLLFAYYLGWLPASGRGDSIFTLVGLKHIIMPALTLGSTPAAVIARMTRSSMLEVLGQDYVRTARSKGLSQRVVVYRHALRNALIPVITLIGLQLGALLSGSVITERVFAWPGLGTLIINAINARDYPTVQAAVLLVAVVFVSVNLIVDLTYARLDPRIRYN